MTNKLALAMDAKIILMAIPPSPLPGTASEVRNQFLESLSAVYDQATTLRNGPAESDWDWLTKGVDRVLSNVRNGRDFLQTFQMFWKREIQVGPHFETLASGRRLGMVAECSALLRRRVDTLRGSPLATFASLATFDLDAGDGHYLEHATHDPLQGETRWPPGHFFALNVKSQSLFPLALADLAGRKKEHDARRLKRQSVARRRPGAGKGARCCGFWDKARVRHQQHSYRALRCNVLRGLLGEDYRRMRRRLAECPLFRWFFGLEELAAVRVPGKSLLQDYAHWLPAETMRPLITQLILVAHQPAVAAALELAHGLELETVWLDTTCLKATFIFRWTGCCWAPRCGP